MSITTHKTACLIAFVLAAWSAPAVADDPIGIPACDNWGCMHSCYGAGHSSSYCVSTCCPTAIAIPLAAAADEVHGTLKQLEPGSEWVVALHGADGAVLARDILWAGSDGTVRWALQASEPGAVVSLSLVVGGEPVAVDDGMMPEVVLSEKPASWGTVKSAYR